jgi:acetoacetyl-CoA reductase
MSAELSGQVGLVTGGVRGIGLAIAGKGITVNCVAPGFIETDMTDAVPAHILEQIVEQIPVHRFGYPEEVARVVEFLAEPASAYITGQVYSVNGGLYM